ncbi:MAG: hypothetical protein REI12_09570 [Pedobacter sp.]|nr:hypothetical protein [Pedobacter sp.]
MNEDEFEDFLAQSVSALQEKQAELEQLYDLSKMSRWTLDEHAGTLSFMDELGRRLRTFAVTPIGTFASNRDSWKWAWANDKIEKPWRERADKLRSLYDVTDYDLFKEEGEFAVDDVMAWELAAMAVQHLGSLGCYRTPNREVFLFLAIDEVVN